MLEKQIAQLENENTKLKLDHEREMQAYKNHYFNYFLYFFSSRTLSEYQKKYEKVANDNKRNHNFKKFAHSKDVLDIVADIVNERIPEHDYARVRDIPEKNLKEDEAVTYYDFIA